MRRVWWLSALLALAACEPPDDEIDIVFDPCGSLALRALDASAEQLDSIEAAADIWTEVGADTELVYPGKLADSDTDGEIPVSFEDGAPMFMGIYRDEIGDIVINESVLDSDHRAVVIAHEVGHAFGLEHVTDRDSVMNQGNIDVLPNDEDLVALMRLWPDCEL